MKNPVGRDLFPGTKKGRSAEAERRMSFQQMVRADSGSGGCRYRRSRKLCFPASLLFRSGFNLRLSKPGNIVPHRTAHLIWHTVLLQLPEEASHNIIFPEVLVD